MSNALDQAKQSSIKSTEPTVKDYLGSMPRSNPTPPAPVAPKLPEDLPEPAPTPDVAQPLAVEQTTPQAEFGSAAVPTELTGFSDIQVPDLQETPTFYAPELPSWVPAVKQFQEGSSPPPLGVGFTQDWLDNIQSGTYSFGDPAFGRTLRQTESNVTGWRRWLQRGLFGRDLTIQSDHQADFATFGNLPIAVPDEGLLGTPLWFLRNLIDLPRAFSADLGRNAGAYINWRGIGQYRRSLIAGDPQPFGLFRDPAERERMLTSTKPADTVANRWANLEAVVSGQVPNYGFTAVRDFGDTNNTFGEFTEEEIRGWELDPANTLREQFRTNYEERTTVGGRRLSFTFMSELPHAILDNFRLGVAVATNNRPSVALRAMKAAALDMLLDPLPIIGPAADIARMISGSRVAVGRTAVVPFTQTSPGNGAYRTAQQMGLDLQAPLESLDLSSLDDQTFIRALELLQQERGLSRVAIVRRNPQLFERLREISARPPSSPAQPTVDVAQGTVQAAPAPIQVGPPAAPQAPLVSTPDDFVDVTTDLSVEAQAYNNALRQWDAWANTVEDLEALLTPEAQPLPATLPVQAAPAPTQVGPYTEPQAPLVSTLDTTSMSFIEVTPDMSVEALAHAQAYNTALRQWNEWFPSTPEALPAPEAQQLPAAPLPAIGAGSKGRDAIRSAVQAAAPTQPVTPQVQSMAAFTRSVRQTPYVDTILNQPAPVAKVPPTVPLAGVTPEVVDTVIKQIEAENLPAQIVRLRSEQVELGRRFLADLDADVLPQLDVVTANLIDTVDAYNGVEILKAAQESGDLEVVQALARNLDVVETPTGTVATVTDQPNPRQLLNAEYNQVRARWTELDDLDRKGLLDPMSAEGEELVLLDERLRDLEYQIKQLDPDGLTSMTSAVTLGRAIEADLLSIQPDVTPAVLDEAMEDFQRIGQDAIEGKPTQAQAELNQVAASIGARIDPVPVQTRENIRVTHQQYLDSIRTGTFTVKELRQVAKDLGISGTYKLNKKALQDYLEKWLSEQVALKDDLVRAENGDILLYRGTGNQQPDFVPPQQAVKPVKKIGSEYYLVSVDNITAPPKSPGLSDELLNQQAEAIAATGALPGALLKPVVVVRNPEAAATYTLVSDAETYYAALKTKELYPKLGEHVSAVVADDEATAALYKEQLSILNEVGPEPILTPSAAPVTEQVGAEYYLIPLKQVTTSAQLTMSAEVVDRLVQSRAASGTFVQPVVVVRTGPQSYELVHGSAVYEAALKFKQLEPRLGEMVPAFVVEGGSLEAAKHQLELLGSKAPAVLDRAKTPRPTQAVDEVDDVGQLPLEAPPPPKPIAAKAKPLGLASAKPVAQPAQAAPSASVASIEAEIAAVEAKLDKALNNNNFKAADALDRKLDKLKVDLARQRKADAEFKDVVPHVPAKPTRPASILDATLNGKPLLEGDALVSFNDQVYAINESLRETKYLDKLKQYTYIVPTAPKPEESAFAAGLQKFMKVDQSAVTQEQIEKLAILRWYTDDLFKPLNKALRGNPNMFDWSTEQAVAIGEYFDEALGIIKLSKSEKVYRAVEQPNIRPQYVEGAVLQNQGYTSTSTLVDVAFSFGGDDGVYYTIENATGYPMHFLSEVYEDEFELLLPRNSTFKVLEVNRDTKNITLRQLDSPPKLADGESLPKLSKAGAIPQPTSLFDARTNGKPVLEGTALQLFKSQVGQVKESLKSPEYLDRLMEYTTIDQLPVTQEQVEKLALVRWYTDDLFKPLNKALRGSPNELAWTAEQATIVARYLDDALSIIEIEEADAVYRGVPEPGIRPQYVEGKILQNPGYTSASILSDVGASFSRKRGVYYTIENATGYPTHFLSEVYEGEAELLIPRGTAFEVVKVDRDANHITLRQLNNLPKLADGESLPMLSKAGAAVQPTGAAQTLMDVATALEDTSRALWARGMKLPKVSDVESAVERFKPLGYTEDQAASAVAVEQYTGQAYSYINAYLRFGEEGLASELRESLTKLSEFGATEEALFTVGDSLVKLIPLIDDGIKLPLYPKHKGTVYRGIIVEELPAKYFPGAVVADPAFMSTSTDLGVVEGFMQSQRAAYKGEAWTFEIQDAVGARINETQKEVLLPRSTELEILSVDSARKYIVAKQVSEPLFVPDNARPSTTTTRFTEEMFAEFMQTVEKLPPSTKRSILESLGEDPYAFWVRDKEEQAEYARLVELGVDEKEAQAEASKFADEVASNLRKPTTGSESLPMLGVGSGAVAQPTSYADYVKELDVPNNPWLTLVGFPKNPAVLDELLEMMVEEGFSPTQASGQLALQAYQSTPLYSLINQYLIGGNNALRNKTLDIVSDVMPGIPGNIDEKLASLGDVIQGLIRLIDARLEDYQKYEGVVYRGVSADKLYQDYKVGDLIVEPAYLSTSVSLDVAEEFRTDSQVRGWLIEIENGSGAFIETGPQREVLIPRGSKFRVLDVNESDKVLRLEQVTSAQPPLSTTGSESLPMLGVGSGTESNLAYNSRTTYTQADLDKVEIHNMSFAGLKPGEKTNLERFQKAFEFVPRNLFDSLDWSNTVLLHQNDMELAIPSVPKDLSYGWSGATLRQGDKTYVIVAGGAFESTTLVHELTHAYFYQIGKENRDVVLPNHAAFVVGDAEVVNYPGWDVVQGNVDRVVAEMVETLGEELEPVKDYVQTAVEGLRKDSGYFTGGTIKPEESDALWSLADAAFNDVDNRVLYELMKGLPEGLSESYKIWLGQVANLKVVDQVLQELGLSTSPIESIELLQGLREVDTVNSFNNPINGYHGLEELITYRIGWDPNYFDTILTRTEPVIPSLQDVTKPTVGTADSTAKLSRAGSESSSATRGGLLPQRSPGYGSGIPGDSDLQTALLQFGAENEFGPGLYTSADVGRGAKYAQGVNRAKPGIQYGDPWVDSYRIDAAANIVRYSELGNYAELHRNGNYAALRELNAKALEDGVDVISTGSGDYIILNPRVVKGVERRAVPGLDTPLQMRAAEYNARLESELDTTIARQNLAQQGLLETGRQYSEILRQASQRYFDQAQQQFTEFAAVRKARKAVEDVQEGFSKIFDGVRKCL